MLKGPLAALQNMPMAILHLLVQFFQNLYSFLAPSVVHFGHVFEDASTTWLAHMFWHFDQSKGIGQVELNHPDTNNKEIVI